MRAVSQNVAGLSLALAISIGAVALMGAFCPAAAADKINMTVLAVMKYDEFAGALREPAGIYFDESKQRLYVADSGNKRLVSFDEKFTYLSELGDARFGSPMMLVKAGEGIFYILDISGAAIKKVNLQDKSVTDVKFTGVSGADFIPGRFAVDKAGNMYVVDRLNGRIAVFDASGKFVRDMSARGDKSFKGMNYVHVGADGAVFGVDSAGQRVYVFDAKGKVKTVLGAAFGGDDEKLKFPSSVTTDANGLIYVADKHDGKILVYGKQGGRPVNYIGMRGLNDGQLYGPVDIAVDSKNRLFILDGARISVFGR